MGIKTRVMISNRHVHLNREALDILFGKGYELTVKKELDPPIFAANETVSLIGDAGRIDGVRILGPLREYNQAEILRADQFVLGTNAEVKISGSPNKAPLRISGPAGEMDFKDVAIIAQRHIHFSPEQAQKFGYRKDQIVRVKVDGDRSLIFDNVRIVITDGMSEPMMHVDREEGNAACINNNDWVEILD